MANKKTTYSLPAHLLAEIDEVVARGAAPSKNALVERAIARELKEIRRQERRRRWQEALNDPLFLQDIREVEEDFREADAETARRIV